MRALVLSDGSTITVIEHTSLAGVVKYYMLLVRILLCLLRARRCFSLLVPDVPWPRSSTTSSVTPLQSTFIRRPFLAFSAVHDAVAAAVL